MICVQNDPCMDGVSPTPPALGDSRFASSAGINGLACDISHEWIRILMS